MGFYIYCNDFAKINGKLICALSNANAMCAIDEDSGKIDYLYSTDDEMDTINLFSSVIRYEDKAFFVPYRAKNILVYNKKTEDFYEIDFKSNTEIKQDNFAFWSSYRGGGIAYLFGSSFPGILKLNMNTENFEMKYIPELEDYYGSNSFFTMGIVEYEDKIYVPMGNYGGLLHFSLQNEAFDVENIPSTLTGVASLSRNEDVFLIIGYYHDVLKLVQWNMKSKSIKEIKLFRFDNRETQRNFHPPVFWKNKVYIFPYSNIHRYYVVDLKENKSYEYGNFYMTCLNNDVNGGGLQFLKQEGSVLHFQTRADSAWKYFDMDKEEIIKEKRYELNDKEFIRKLTECQVMKEMRNSKIIDENNGYLDAFIRLI